MITYNYTEDDKKDIIKCIPFHIERIVDVESENNLSSFLFNDDLMLENPLEEIIEILLDKTPLNSSNNYDLDIIRDPGRKDVPSLFYTSEFWQTFFKHALGSTYNETILYSYNRLKFPYVNEISLLYDSIFEGYKNIDKDIYFEDTLENEEISSLKLDSLSKYLSYTNPQVELIDYWLTHAIASGIITESESERETVLYRSQDLRNELLRRKVAGSLIGYTSLLNSINVTGSLYPAVPITADENSSDPRLSRGLNLPGITTTIPDIGIDPAAVFDDIPTKLLIPAYYSSLEYNQDDFLSSPSDFLRFKNGNIVWDNLSGITDASLVKVSYYRLDQNPIDTLDEDPLITLDDETPIFALSVSSESFLDIQANKIYNIKNTLQVKKGDLYPYYIDTVAQSFGPALSDIPWLSYIEKFIDEKKRVSETVKIGMQVSLLDNGEENYVTIRELGFSYKENMTDEDEDYIYDENVHNYMFIYSVEIQYHRSSFTVRIDYPKKTLMTIIYLKQEPSTEDLSAYDSYNDFISYSTGLLPFKYKNIEPSTIPNYTLLIDEDDIEDKVKDYVEDASYSRAHFFFMPNDHERLLIKDTITPVSQLLSITGENFSEYPYTLNSFYFMYGYEHEDDLAYWSNTINITRVDYLMDIVETRPDWSENIFYINPQLNFNVPNCTHLTVDGEYLQSLSDVHGYGVYNNDEDRSTTAQLVDGPIGFFLNKHRDVLDDDSINEVFQIWGDYRYAREEYTLTVTLAPTSGGSLYVELDGAAEVLVLVLITDTEEEVATKIAAESYPGWTAVATAASVVFTADTIVEKTGTFEITTSTGLETTFLKTTDIGDVLDDALLSIYRNDPQEDNYGINTIYLNGGDAFASGTLLDTYYEIIPSTTVVEADRPEWYWNRTDSDSGMTFFTKIMFSDDGITSSNGDDMALISRKTGSGADDSAGDEFEIYYDQTAEEFIFKVYPTGYSVDNVGSGNLGQLVFSVSIPFVMQTTLPIRLGFTYKLTPDVDDISLQVVSMVAIVDGVSQKQTYTITKIGTTGDIETAIYTATYNVYDENAMANMLVAGSADITLDDSVFRYNERYQISVWEHFLGKLHKDGGQTNYTAEGIDLFQRNKIDPFMGRVYDVRLHTTGFTQEEMNLYNKGTRREILTNNIDSAKVINHFTGDFALGRRADDAADNTITKIRAFSRGKWRSNLIDPQTISTGETNPLNDRYNVNYQDPLDDTDVYTYEGEVGGDLEDPLNYDDTSGVIKSFLKNNLEVISGFSWDSDYKLYYKRKLIETLGKQYDLIQTSLYPTVYEDYPVFSNADFVNLDGALKAYKLGGEHLPSGATAINITTVPSGDTLVYKCDMVPYFKMSTEIFPTRAFYKGDRLQHTLDSTLDAISIEISDSKEVPGYLSRLLIMPLYIPRQSNIDSTALNALNMKGLKAGNTLKKLLDPTSYYQEFLYPYDNGYRIDVVKAIKEGVYFVPIKIPMMMEADYNLETRKIFYTIETLMKIEVVGTVVDNSAIITSDNVTDYYDATDTAVEVDGIDPDEFGESIYRKITIKAYFYRYNEGTDWGWSQVLSNDETEVVDTELAYDPTDPTITKDVEFYLSNKLAEDEYFDWTGETFEDRATNTPPVGNFEIWDEFDTPTVDTPYIQENSSYLLYLNMRSVTTNVRFSSDISCAPYDSVLFENPNNNDTTELLNDRMDDLEVNSSTLNYGYSISGGVFENVDTASGKLGDPYANDQSNYLLDDLDYNFINNGMYTMKYTSFFTGVDALNSFPVGFYVDDNNDNSNTTTIFDDEGNLLDFNINEKEALSSHLNARRIQQTKEVVSGFYSMTPLIDTPLLDPINEVSIDVNASPYAYQLSLNSRTVPKWSQESNSYDEFKLFKDVFYEKIEDLGDSYSSVYYLEYDYTAPGSYSITFSGSDIKTKADKAYVQISLTIEATINETLIPASTPTWISVDMSSGKIILTSDTITVMSILNIKPYQVDTTELDYRRFLSIRDNTGELSAVITAEETFIYLSEDADERKWFIQFASSYNEDTLSSDPAFTSFNDYLADFISLNLDTDTNDVSNPWIHTIVYKEEGDKVTTYIKNNITENSPNNLIYIDDTMKYNSTEDSIDIGNADPDTGIHLNESRLSHTNLLLANDVLIQNEKMTALNNCINTANIQARKASVNAITNIQLMSGDSVTYEFEIPPLIYDELTQHISFNILMSR